MCGRYALYGPPSRYREYFDTRQGFDAPPRFNVAPSLVVPVVRQNPDGSRDFILAKWGLVPAGVRDAGGVKPPINIRAETAAVRPISRQAFRTSRILVPADCFYEWTTVAGARQPYLIRLRDGSPFGIAGILEHRPGSEGEAGTFAILTTEPNRLLAQFHNRMPAIIRPQDHAAWLDPSVTDVQALREMLPPFPEDRMQAYAVSRKVNNALNEGPDLIEPLTAEQ